MKKSRLAVVLSAVLIPGLMGGQALAEDSDICSMAKANLVYGGPKYADVVYETIQMLSREGIFYTTYGSFCPGTSGGCGADLFEVDNYPAPDKRGHPSVWVKPKSAALNEGDNYYLFGKLTGRIQHEACGPDTLHVNGHGWAASFHQGEIAHTMGENYYVEGELPRIIGKGIRFKTTVSRAGNLVASGYKMPSYWTSDDVTYLVKVSAFQGNADAFRKFTEFMGELGE